MTGVYVRTVVSYIGANDVNDTMPFIASFAFESNGWSLFKII